MARSRCYGDAVNRVPPADDGVQTAASRRAAPRRVCEVSSRLDSGFRRNDAVTVPRGEHASEPTPPRIRRWTDPDLVVAGFEPASLFEPGALSPVALPYTVSAPFVKVPVRSGFRLSPE
jgi:hypothetical protein